MGLPSTSSTTLPHTERLTHREQYGRLTRREPPATGHSQGRLASRSVYRPETPHGLYRHLRMDPLCRGGYELSGNSAESDTLNCDARHSK